MIVKIRKLRVWILACVAWALTGCSGGEEAGGPAPAEVPAPSEKAPEAAPGEATAEKPGSPVSTGEAPQAVLARFASALASGDRGDLVACLDTATAGARTMATLCESAMILLERTAAFQKAVAEKFGDDVAASLSFLSEGGNVVERLGALKDQIIASRIDVQGDRARVAVEGLPDGTLALVRRNDRWLVQLGMPSSNPAPGREDRLRAERELFVQTIEEANAALAGAASPDDLRSELDRIEARMVARRLAIQAASGTGVPRTN